MKPIDKNILNEISNELHKPVNKKFIRRKVITEGIDDVFSIDIVDMKEWEKYNDGFKYMLNIVDCFSRFAWAIPLKNKNADDVLKALKDLFQDTNRIPRKIWVDKGGEFYNKKIDTYLKKNNISRYSTYSESKSVIVERFNRTLKTNMWRRFTAENTRKWIDMLPELVDTYNNSTHRAINMSPTEEASIKKNESQLWNKLYSKYLHEQEFGSYHTKPKFKLGDYVRISRVKGAFEKGYYANWSQELFKITTINHTTPITYNLTDLNNEPIEGSFYENELQKSNVDKDVGLIEQILQKKKINSTNMVLVKWLGYDKKFNSWIPAKDAQNIYQIIK